MRSQDYWALAYNKPSFLDFGFVAKSKNFGLVARFDIMQDVLTNLEEPSSLKTNIPFIGALLDLTFPRVGYVDFLSNDESLYISAGRRLLKWGPASYDIQVDASQPYLDNIWASYTTDVNNTGKWKFNYNYVIVSPKFWMDYKNDMGFPNTVEKTILGHKFNFYNDNVRLSFGELANVYNKTPSFFDLSPLVIWHDGNQDDTVNVSLYLSGEGKAGPVRMFGTFNMDDFDLPHETHSDKPVAMGFNAGIEYHVFDGNPITSQEFTKEDYILKEATLKEDNGLNIGFEWYFVSPMMYNRTSDLDDDQRNGKFTIPFQFVSLIGDGYVYDYDAYFLGFKYGPNARLFKLYAEYKDKPFEANFIAELLTRGAYSIESSYGNRDKLDEMGVIEMLKLAGEKTTVLLLNADFAYYIQDSLKLLTGIQFQQDFTHKKSAYAFSLGFSCNPFNTDWKNLFK